MGIEVPGGGEEGESVVRPCCEAVEERLAVEFVSRFVALETGAVQRELKCEQCVRNLKELIWLENS